MSRLLGDAQKEGAGGLSSGPSFLAACGLGGRGIGRHQLLMSAGIAACRAVRKRGALLAAHSPSVMSDLP